MYSHQVSRECKGGLMSFLRRMMTGVVGAGAAIAMALSMAPAAHADDAVDSARRDLTTLQIEAAEVQRNLETSQQEQEKAQRQYDLTAEDLTDQRELVEKMRVQVGRVAVAAHQQAAGMGTAKLLFTSDSEDSFLSEMSVIQSVTAITDEQLTRLAAEEARLRELETTQANALTKVNAEVKHQSELSAEYDKKVADAAELVGRLTVEQQSRLAQAQNDAILAANAASLAKLPSNISRDGLNLPTGSGQGVWPANGPLTSPFGYRVNPIGGHSELHDGTDIGAACGTPVVSAWTGVVVSAQVEGGWGNRIIVDSGMYKAAYNHLQTMSVSPGQTVTAGQVIGAVGTTGYSTGCHLHFSTWVNGQITDPMSIF